MTPNQTIQTLTPQQKNILILLFRFRFLNTIQIQSFLKLNTRPRLNTWLHYLVEQEYLGMIYSHRIGENTKPAIYYLRPKARTVLREQTNISDDVLQGRLYKEGSRSNQFIDHCILLGQTYLLMEQEALSNRQILHFHTKSEIASLQSMVKPLPDAFLTFRNEKKSMKRYFLDIFGEGLPRFALRSRLRVYRSYLASGDWELSARSPFPKILWVCPNETVLSFLSGYIANSRPEDGGEDISVYLTTQETLLKRLDDPSVPLWREVA